MTQYDLFNHPSPFELLFKELAAEDGDPDGLRYYQREAFGRVTGCLARVRACLAVMATGTGKTRLFRTVAKHQEGRILVLAERDELITQAKKELEGIGEEIGVEKAEQRSRPEHRIVVGSVQSLKKERLERLEKQGGFALIIVDECHHAVAPSYLKIFAFFKGAKIFGVTATPDRGDRQALGKVFDEVAYTFDIEDGIDSGYLVPIRGQRIICKGLELDGIRKAAGDLPAGALDRAMFDYVDWIVQETLRLEPHRTAICFFPGRRTAELAAERFNHYRPGSAAYVDGFTNPDVRAGIMAAFKQGRLRYLCNCAVATEGFDAPNADMVVLARPTLSRALYAQMIGRGGRVLPYLLDHLDGEAFAAERRAVIAKSRKPDMMILDFVGNSEKHDLVTAVDILGGRYTEQEVKLAKKIVKQGENVKEALERAREHIKALAALPKNEVKSEVVQFDPFSVLGLKIQERDYFSNLGQFGAKRAGLHQLARLAAWGMPQGDIDQLSFRGAQRLIDKITARLNAGYCTFKQLAFLRRYGVTDQSLTFDRANAAIDYIKKGRHDAKILDEILHHQRAAGED